LTVPIVNGASLPSTEYHQRTAERNERRILSTGRSQEITCPHIIVLFCNLVEEVMLYENVESNAHSIHTISIE
jgi:hypothetical protein